MSATFDYASLATKAQELLTRFGRSMTLTRPARTPDVAKPWQEDQGPTAATAAQSVSVTAVMIGPDQGLRAGTVIPEKDARVYVSALESFVEDPSVEYSLTDGTETHRVANLRKVAPGGTTLLYIGDVIL